MKRRAAAIAPASPWVISSEVFFWQILSRVVSLRIYLRQCWDKGIAIRVMILRIVIAVKMVVKFIFCVLQSEARWLR